MVHTQIGRPAFDEFLKKYIATFKFQSIDTDMFLNFLKANVPGIENEIDLQVWTEGTGIPSDAMEPVSNIYSKIVSLSNEFKLGRMPREDEVADWQGQEWELYLENLPKSVEASQVTFSVSSLLSVTLLLTVGLLGSFFSLRDPWTGSRFHAYYTHKMLVFNNFRSMYLSRCYFLDLLLNTARN